MTRRSLMLAGGGLKIAYQAGVLQVWLDEAAIDFDHADAVSAATFNLAMWCQGMSGRQIADNWRRIRRNVFPAWGLDFDAIRSSPRQAGFNVYNVTEQRVEVLPAAKITEDVLAAAGALPVFFPPVTVGGQLYVDAVHAGAANLEEAIEQGADELWIIWTTSTAGRWRNGPVGQFFGIFELATNSRLRAGLDRIDHSNAAVARGERGTYGRHITVHLLEQEVLLHSCSTSGGAASGTRWRWAWPTRARGAGPGSCSDPRPFG